MISPAYNEDEIIVSKKSWTPERHKLIFVKTLLPSPLATIKNILHLIYLILHSFQDLIKFYYYKMFY